MDHEANIVRIHELSIRDSVSLLRSTMSSSTSSNATHLDLQRRVWWKEAVIYQIYPSSFCDSNGDGIGDINGIITKLDYLKDLGVDALWLCPIFKSPQVDMGYDISDYCDIDPRYGTLQDWDRLVAEMHARNMKIIMDLVANHTSDQHEWFQESRSSNSNPKRDWYYWRPPKFDANGERLPPNNWKSMQQVSAWDWDETTGEYYLHLYDQAQPDLNWENPEVRAAVHSAMKFWLDRGCDGFRLDVINKISKVPGLPDAPIVNPDEYLQPAGVMYVNGPRVHEFIKEMDKNVLSKYDEIMTVGEVPMTQDMDALAKYVLPANHELNMVFQFQLMEIDASGPKEHLRHLEPKPWTVEELREVVSRWQMYRREDGFWNTIFIENHDTGRSVSRFGSDTPQWRAVTAKLLAMLQITQSGTLYVYQGEEIGMANVPTSWGIEEYKDVASLVYYNQILRERTERAKGGAVDMSDILSALQKKGRDNARTPMQWDASENAGFGAGTPWMRVNDDYKNWNVQEQLNRSDSTLAFWKKALRLRKEHEVLVYGDFRLLDEPAHHETVFAFSRSLGKAFVIVLLNFSDKEATVNFEHASAEETSEATLLLSNYEEAGAEIPLVPTQMQTFAHGSFSAKLRGYEGRIYSM
ncbi:glycoside hydrolase family 13 protein [Schizopora paradoxa]|uniref:Glycoside hydrolase family 13 protein n=1 Tax=Schizopora paradoxa TaxID=27342 RepID=A0A0H2RH77_9AGAM|nr:glycoside hydrolase family 13 protein [Schizopora paradoxa]